jgi:hypothetical protein
MEIVGRSLRCEESIVGVGFSRCTATVTVSISNLSAAAKSGTLWCDVDFHYWSRDALLRSREQGYATDFVTVRARSRQLFYLDMPFEPGLKAVVDPVVRVVIGDIACRVR